MLSQGLQGRNDGLNGEGMLLNGLFVAPKPLYGPQVHSSALWGCGGDGRVGGGGEGEAEVEGGGPMLTGCFPVWGHRASDDWSQAQLFYLIYLFGSREHLKLKQVQLL